MAKNVVMHESGTKMRRVAAEEALPGRAEPIPTAERHAVLGRPLQGPYPDAVETIYFGMGCFWGAERRFWQLPGVWVTAVGYIAGHTPNPTYEEVCTGRTGHAEAVMVIYHPERIALSKLLRVFWEGHDPTQGMRQGNDIGTQYRSGIWCTRDEQLECAKESCKIYGAALLQAGLGLPTTEIALAGPFYFAEGWHQQYLAKNPGGYCGTGGTGVPFPAEQLVR